MPSPSYQPFYCEENIWQLCQDPRLGASERLVGLITGPNGPQRSSRCAFWHQRLADSRGEAVLWDFHVVLFVRSAGWQVWDLDSDLGMPVAADAYLSATFGDQMTVATHLQPRIRLVGGEAYVAGLCSDRSHMRDGHGLFLQPPPPWPAPGGGRENNLARYLDPTDPALGVVVTLDGLRARLALPPSAVS